MQIQYISSWQGWRNIWTVVTYGDNRCVALVVMGQPAAFKYPSLRVQTRPKPSGFLRAKKSSARLPLEGK